MMRLTVKELKLRAKELGLKGYSKLNKAELIELIEKAELKIAEDNLEPQIKTRTTEFDMAYEMIKNIAGDNWSLQNFKINGYCSAVKDRKLTINFEIDENYKITKILGGDIIAYGDWYDLEVDDERLIQGAEELQGYLNKLAEENVELKIENVYRIYPQEADKIIEERKIKGKFYLRDVNGWVGIDNETGDAWTEDFKTLRECINWLLEVDEFNCSYCENNGDYTVSIYIEFKDGTDYTELIGSYNEEDIIPYIKELIEKEGWENEVESYSYGYYCPYCLECLE